MKTLDWSAGLGIVCREYLTDAGKPDYVLFVDRKPVGVIEAKPEDKGLVLNLVEEQSARYATAKRSQLSEVLYRQRDIGMTAINTATAADIAQIANICELTPEKTQAFFDALHHGDQPLVSQLLTALPALVNAVDQEQDKSAFELALAGGLSKIAWLLIESEGLDVNHQGHHPLRVAIDLGYLDLAEQLLTKGSNPNYRPDTISSALLLCLEKEYFALAELMVQHGAEVDIRNDNGWTPLIWAAIKGRKTAVEFLLKHGATIHLCNNDGWNAITGAYFKKRLDVVDILKEAGAVFGASYSEAALLSAYQNGYLDIVHTLLDQGVSPNVCDDKGESLLIKAAQNGHHDLLTKLIACKGDVNCLSASLWPLITILTMNGHTELVKLVLEAGADVNLAADDDVTALHVASNFNHPSTVRLLIEQGANSNAATKDRQWTPLMIAAQKGYKEVVEILLEAGVNTQFQNKDNRTAKVLARKTAPRNRYNNLEDCAHQEILELLTLPGHFIDAD